MANPKFVVWWALVGSIWNDETQIFHKQKLEGT